MAEISVLAEGYVARIEGGKLRASPSVVLIEDAGIRILVDPGVDRKGLLFGLSKKDLHPEDVDLLFVTHNHLDHILNLRLFPETDVCDYAFIYRGDEEIPYGKFIPGTRIEVLPTPGHSPDHASLLVLAGAEMWLVAGDLFWWWDDAFQRTDFESLMGLEDECATDPTALRMSRMTALARADVVIPGHGKIFRLIRRSETGLQ